LLGALATLPLARSQNASAAIFPQGVASGDPSDSGMVLWTRVGPERYRAGAPLWLELSESPDFVPALLRIPISTAFGPETDFTVQVDFSGLLQPGRHYYYRFRYLEVYSPTGRSKTLPAPGQNQPIRLGLVSCQEFSSGYYAAYAHLARENLDAVLHLGDFIYEYSADPRYRRPRVPHRTFSLPSGSYLAVSLADFRQLYRSYRDPLMQAAMAAHPFIVMWDDHEFANDTYWDAARDAPGAPDHPFKNAPERLKKLRLEANQAWREYVPSRCTFEPTASDPRQQLSTYRSLRFGDVLELFLTDTRSFRSPHPCGPDARTLNNCTASGDAGRTLLGAAQLEWLLQGLQSSTARWRGLGSAVMFSPLTALGTTLNLDGWDGFAYERNRIMETLQDARNLIVLSGDLHSALAGRISPGFAGQPVIGMEFMAPSLTSPNPRDSLGTRFPWPGNRAVELLNPWLEFFDGEMNGYAILELAEQVTYEVYAVDKGVNGIGANKQRVRRVVVN
jgi:alkaline phosphatase D